MGLTRHEVREAEFLLIYEKMFRDESIADLVTQHETDYEYKCDEEIEKTARTSSTPSSRDSARSAQFRVFRG